MYQMETMDTSIPDVGMVGVEYSEGNAPQAEHFEHRVDEIFMKVDRLEQTLNEVEQFYSTANRKQLNTPKGSSIVKDKDKEKQIGNFKKRQQDASRREAAAAKRMQELIRQFGTVFRQLTQHKWAGPFMQPVDVEGLGLHDYYEVIEKPMDFSTVKNKMEAKDGSGYKNVREVCADVRLIFKNAMKYNDERDDVHVMAKTLLAKFEEKWLQLLPKVDEEEKRRKEEEAEEQLDIQLAQEAAHAKMARDLSIELDEVDMHLEKLREQVIQRCRRMSIEEKRRLGTALTRLSPEDLNKALQIVAEDNPSFLATSEEVDLDMDAQSESTLWKLKFFVKDCLLLQGKSSASMEGNNNNNKTTTTNINTTTITPNNTSNGHQNNNGKRKRDICDALVKSSQKKGKRL